MVLYLRCPLLAGVGRTTAGHRRAPCRRTQTPASARWPTRTPRPAPGPACSTGFKQQGDRVSREWSPLLHVLRTTSDGAGRGTALKGAGVPTSASGLGPTTETCPAQRTSGEEKGGARVRLGEDTEPEGEGRLLRMLG